MRGSELPDAFHDPLNIGVIAAICGGCGMLVLLILLFLTVAIIHKHSNQRQVVESKVQPIKGTDGPLYAGVATQSTMGLMSQMSSHSFASSPSEIFNTGALQHRTVHPDVHQTTSNENSHQYPNVIIDDKSKGILYVKGVENIGYEDSEARGSAGDVVDDQFVPLEFKRDDASESHS